MISNGHLDIRPIAEDELGSVLAIYRQCEDFLALGPDPSASVEMIRDDLRHSRVEGGTFCSIYDATGTMLGVVDFVAAGFEDDPRQAFISLIMIAAPYRRSGIGGEVVSMIEAEIVKSARIQTICSAVQANNPAAIRFWQRHGYRIVGGPELQPDGTTVLRLRKSVRRPHF